MDKCAINILGTFYSFSLSLSLSNDCWVLGNQKEIIKKELK